MSSPLQYEEEIRDKGYTVIENVLNSHQLEEAHFKLDEIYSLQVGELDSEEIIGAINDKDISRALLAYDDFFLYNVAANENILSLIKSLLGNYFILREQNGINNRPSQPNYQIKWHRDLLYQNFVISTPIAISVLVCLDEFNDKTGGTYVLPGSHKLAAIPLPDYVDKNEICINAPAGSAIAFDAMLYHRAGYNSSSGLRRAVNSVYALPFVSQPISFPNMLKKRNIEDPALRILLGFETEPDADVKAWRLKRYKRKAVKS